MPAADARGGTFVAVGIRVPAAQQAACAAKVVQQLLNLWPAPNGPELTLPGGGLSGIAAVYRQPAANHSRGFRHGARGSRLLREGYAQRDLHH